MKKSILVFAVSLFISLGLSAQMVNINRWVSPIFKDYTSIPENKGIDAQIASWGYTGKIFQYRGFLTPPDEYNSTGVNRWEMPNCKEFIIIAEHELTDAQLMSWGYKNKTFLFYAFKNPPPQAGYVAVNRWVNALPKGNNCRDFTLSVAEFELTDEQLISWGYSDKKTQFYVMDSR